jgi:hypothetical protein
MKNENFHDLRWHFKVQKTVQGGHLTPKKKKFFFFFSTCNLVEWGNLKA